jgi:hypothetical protein
MTAWFDRLKETVNKRKIEMPGTRVTNTHSDAAMYPTRRLYTLAQVTLFTLAGSWSTAIAYGTTITRKFKSTPGAIGFSPTQWPVQLHIVPPLDRSRLDTISCQL